MPPLCSKPDPSTDAVTDAPPDPTAPSGADVAERLEVAKRASSAQLLLRCARLLNELGIARVRARTGQPLRASHTNLFPHIDLEGTRLTTLAQRLGVSKQAVGQLVDELIAMGVLERVPDPTDGRARLIQFRDGGAGLMRGLAVLNELEEELAAEVGVEQMQTLREILLALQPLLEARTQREL